MDKIQHEKFLNNHSVYKLGNREYVIFSFPGMRGVIKFSFSHEGYPEALPREIDRVGFNYFRDPITEFQQKNKAIEENQFRVMANPESSDFSIIYLFKLSDQGKAVHVSIEHEPDRGKSLYGDFERSLPMNQIIFTH